jgi:alpha,alpha-trehalase
MLELKPAFRAKHRKGEYPRLEDMGLIGDGTTAALVSLDGGIPWLCLPRFDSEPLFCGLLDVGEGGHFIVAPENTIEARQYYEPGTAVLHTEFQTTEGRVRVTDAMGLRSGADLTDVAPAGRGELIRSAVVLDGSARLRVELEPRGGGTAQPAAGGLYIRPSRQPSLNLYLRANRPLESLCSSHRLEAGERLDLVLSSSGLHRHHRFGTELLLRNTIDACYRWMDNFHYGGPEAALVRRSAITLKLCDHWSSGSIVAAPTSSLPAPVGGVRNWDYRYTWVRDASFSVYALRRIGFDNEAGAFLGWVLDAFERARQPRTWGNGAADQRQHDVYGDILDCAYQWVRGGGALDTHLDGPLAALADSAMHAWCQADQGIWEVRNEGRSAGMCQVALDRAASLADRLGYPERASTWRQAADGVRQAILQHAWDENANTLSEVLDGGGSLDASLLALPLRRVIPADEPRMVATTAAVAERLSAGDGLLYRYLHEESPDGIPGDEGAFVLCSFWLVENLAKQGKLEEAANLYASLCGRASPLGFLPEQIDPCTGSFIGNFPQAFSHIGVIASGVTLERAGVRG